MIRLSKKFIRRAITGLALLAPIVYLFGSQFFALNGAHASFPFAVDYELPVDSRAVDFNQQVLNGDFADSSRWFPFYSQIEISSNKLRLINDGHGNDTSFGTDVRYVVGHKYILTFTAQASISATLYFGSQLLDSSNSSYQVLASNISVTNAKNVYRYVFTPTRIGSSVTAIYNFMFRCYGTSSGAYVDFSDVMLTDLTQCFGDGNEPSSVDFAKYFPLAYYQYTLSDSISIFDYAVPDNSQYLFNQFFAKNNFLEQWGYDAISETPHGFAPFGNMLQFVDENMLHLSDLQIGLMGYGYFYYCAHVLLFVCFFDLTTFFLSWILRISHKFGGADYED